LELVSFIVDVAGPTKLNVLSLIINAKDHIGLTPLYLLCEHGYSSDELRKYEHSNRCSMIKLLIPKGLDLKNENVADWMFSCPQTFYTPMHWLAYWNDSASVKYMLKDIVEANVS
jgi:hypothetical protein